MLKPINDRVLVARVEEELDKTAGGLFIPEKSREKPQEGIVLAVGPGRYVGSKLVPLTVKVGDRVLLAKYSGTEVNIGKTKAVLMREEEILGVMEP